MIELLKDTRLDNIFEDKRKNLIEKSKVSYNLFTLSSYNNHLENFHSDVLASLLDPEGMHGEGRLFLEELFAYINKELELLIDLNSFQDPIVKREQGRLDIIVFDNISGHAIIIENKINDAPDMDDQLIRYYDWCKKNKLTTVAILYVSLRGLKKAPPVTDEMKNLVNNVAAFSSSNSDLVNGWLSICIDKCTNIDTKSLIIQYNKLIKQLAFDSMEKNIMDDFYKIVNEPGSLKKIRELIELTSKIPAYRADKLQSSIEDYRPFKKTLRYKPNYVLFEHYLEGENSFKLDISFDEDGSAWIGLWNPKQRNEKGNTELKKKVEQITNIVELEPEQGGGWFSRRFNVEDYGSMYEMDHEIIDFTKKLMKALNESVFHK